MAARDHAPQPKAEAPAPLAPEPVAKAEAPQQAAATATVATLSGNKPKEVASRLPVVQHNLNPLDLSRPPTREELMAAGQLGGQLYPTGEVADPERAQAINLSFGQAIELWNEHKYPQAVALFQAHIARYPDSPWKAEAELHMGCDAQYTGRYSEANQLFNSIITAFSGQNNDGALKMVNKATLRLAVLRAFQNNFEESQKLFSELIQNSDNWREQTYASHWLQRLSVMSGEKIALLNCGTMALAHLLEKDGKPELAGEVRKIIPRTSAGQSIKDIRLIASLYGYSFEGYRLSKEKLASIPLPAIVRLAAQNAGDSGHYWVLEKVEKGRLEFFDAQAGRMFSQTPEQFAKEWNGDVLVLENPRVQVASLGEKLSDAEISGSFGGCCGVPAPPVNLGRPGVPKKPPCGAPDWSVNPVNTNLFVQDVPLWYESPIGPPVEIGLSYNSQSSIAQHEPFGDKWMFNYGSYLVVDTGGQVTVFMPDGRHDIYSPDGSGGYIRPSGVFNTLTKIAENHFKLTFKDGGFYEYNIPAGTSSLQPFLVNITDPFGQTLTLGYDASINLTTITDALGRATTLTYNAGGQVTKVTDPFARFASFSYTGTTLTGITDMAGYATTLSYDAKVNVTSIANTRGTWTFLVEPADGIYNGSNPFPPPGGTMWANARVTVTDPTGHSELFAYNGYSHYGYHVSPNYFVPYVDSSNNSFASPSVKRTRYNYTTVNGFGEVSSATFPDGGVQSYSYDSATGLPNGSTDPHGHLTSFQYNSMGSLLSVTNAKNQQRTMAYASNGVDMTSLTSSTGTISFTYNPQHQVTSLTDRLGKTTLYSYNAYGQLTSLTDPLGTVTTFTYYASTDPAKYQLKSVSRGGVTLASYTYDSIGRLQTRTDATGVVLSYDRDSLNRITAVHWPDAKTQTYVYSGCCPRLLDSYTDRTGRTFSYSYDAVQRLTEIDNPDGTSVRFAYDPDGNMIKLTDANSNATSYSYDALDRLVGKSYADGKGETLSYDTGGLLVSTTGGRGITTSFSYDATHNVTGISYSDATPAVALTYDSADRLVSKTDATGATAYSYDARDRLTSMAGPWVNDTISYTYDALGRRTSMNLDTAEGVSYAYDVFDRLTQLNVGSRRFSYSYPAASASPVPVSLTRPNGSVTTFTSDSLSRLTGVATATTGAVTVLADSFSYNSLDQRGSETVTGGLASPTLTASLATFDYNNLNELMTSSNPTRNYLYDADGNLLQGFTPDGYQFAATYDGANRLKSLDWTDASAVAHHSDFQYTGFGMLAKQVVDGVETRFIRQGYSLLAERNGSNVATRSLVWNPRVPGGVGGLLEVSQGTDHYAPFYDGKGNVRGILDSSQSVAAAYNYDPYGALLSKSGTVDQPYRFSTKSYDEKSGLAYYGFRFYSPVLGRWLNRDPLGELGGLNLYEFVQGNPVNYVDPFGLKIQIDGTAEQAQDYHSAIAYLAQDPGMKTIIRDLENSATVYHISFNDQDDDSYVFGSHTINWDPRSALCTQQKGRQSPALGLGHEMAHADESDFVRNILRNINVDDYQNMEELRVIAGPETAAAHTLGEDVRVDHYGTTYKVDGPNAR